jgi:hypothetical protein
MREILPFSNLSDRSEDFHMVWVDSCHPPEELKPGFGDRTA